MAEAKKWCNEMCERIWRYILMQLTQPSTYRGLALIATAVGITAAPELYEAITAAGLLVSGIIGAAFPDKVKP
jgi:hypothetical protein